MKNIVIKTPSILSRKSSLPVLDDFENLVDRFFSSYIPYSGEAGMVQMPMELIERDDNFIMRFMIPGIKKDDLNIEITENQVSVCGTCKVDYEENKDLIHRSEFCRGNFSRVVALPQEINHEKSKADYKDGILEINMPKKYNDKNKVTKLSI